jgi:putative Holliday junction resolvase
MPRNQVGRIIGLDVGERRIGVAISTPEGGLAVPLRIIDRKKEPDDLAAILALATSEAAEAFVVGYPLSLDGTAGHQARHVEGFARRLRHQTGVAVELWDERLTSVQAKRSMTGQKPGPIDDIAAAIILQSYLDSKRTAAAQQ